METYQLISNRLSEVRRISLHRSFKLPEANDVFGDLKELVFYIINNFNIPESHKEYIINQFAIGGERIKDEIIHFFNHAGDYFKFDESLRAMEVIFSFGRPKDIEIHTLDYLNYLISKLHVSVGKEVF